MPTNLKPINTTILQTMMITNLAKVLEDNKINNCIYLIKTGMIVRYKTLEVVMDSGDKYLFTDMDNNDSLVMINKISRTINSIKIITYTDSVLYLSKMDIHALRGIKLICYTELAIEYYRCIINEILYDNKELLRYCSRNHLLDDDGMDLLELLDYNKGSLTEDDVFYISNTIKELPGINEIEMLPIRRIANSYKYNPKRISFNKYAITIDIYDDVRVIRFNELNEMLEKTRKDCTDDEDDCSLTN